MRPQALGRDAVAELVRAALGAEARRRSAPPAWRRPEATRSFCASCSARCASTACAGRPPRPPASVRPRLPGSPARCSSAWPARRRRPRPGPRGSRAGRRGRRPRHAAELAGLDAAAAAAADALASADVLESERPPRFVHPLVGAAVHGDMPAGARALRKRAAALLSAAGAEPERVAVHLLGADPASDEQAVATLLAAGARARPRGAGGRRALRAPRAGRAARRPRRAPAWSGC